MLDISAKLGPPKLHVANRAPQECRHSAACRAAPPARAGMPVLAVDAVAPGIGQDTECPVGPQGRPAGCPRLPVGQGRQHHDCHDCPGRRHHDCQDRRCETATRSRRVCNGQRPTRAKIYMTCAATVLAVAVVCARCSSAMPATTVTT